MDSALTFTLTQSLQIAAIIPCLFVIGYLVVQATDIKKVMLPIAYFLCLAAGMLYYVLPALTQTGENLTLGTSLLALDSTISVISFLLITQFLLNKNPPFAYWTIILAPLLATTPYIYASLTNEQLCLDNLSTCFPVQYSVHYTNVILSSFVFMLLTLIISRKASQISGDKALKKHKYWLIISLIAYNLILLGLDLAVVGEKILQENYILTKTLVKVAFIYVVITSIFRVFSDTFDIKEIPHIKDPTLTAYEKELSKRVTRLFEEEKVYRELGFNRNQLAQLMGVKEHLLSKVINIEFKKSFSEIANSYRIAEAKTLLLQTQEPITVISYDVGFTSITSFNRVFKEMTGMAPSDFRTTKKQQVA